MPTSKEPSTGSQYMAPREVADQLGFKSRSPVYDLFYAGELTGIAGAGSTGKGLRIARKSFEDYCARLEQETAARLAGDDSQRRRRKRVA
jgi:hypothetical protein